MTLCSNPHCTNERFVGRPVCRECHRLRKRRNTDDQDGDWSWRPFDLNDEDDSEDEGDTDG